MHKQTQTQTQQTRWRRNCHHQTVQHWTLFTRGFYHENRRYCNRIIHHHHKHDCQRTRCHKHGGRCTRHGLCADRLHCLLCRWLDYCCKGIVIMAKRHITPLGKHKPVGSSWASMDMAYSHTYEPEDKPEFHSYVTGQFPAMQDQWRKAQEKKTLDDAASIMATLL